MTSTGGADDNFKSNVKYENKKSLIQSDCTHDQTKPLAHICQDRESCRRSAERHQLRFQLAS